MKVAYLVMETEDYEPSRLIGLYTTSRRANGAVERAIKAHSKTPNKHARFETKTINVTLDKDEPLMVWL